MSNFIDDPLKIIPKDFTNNGSYKIVKFIAPDNALPKDYKITVRFSYGSEINYGYLRVLREYLDSLNA